MHTSAYFDLRSQSKEPIEREITADAVPNQHYAAKLTITGNFPEELHLRRTRSIGESHTHQLEVAGNIGDPYPTLWLQGNEAELRAIMNKQVRDAVVVTITQANISCDAYNITWSIPRNVSKTR